MTIIDAELPSCEKCGKPFTLRSGSGGSVQLFCGTDCRLSFHAERLRSQRTGAYAGQLPQPATQEPATMFEQAERLIAKLTPDERCRLIAGLLADVPPNKVEKAPELPLEQAAPAVPKNEHDGFAEFIDQWSAVSLETLARTVAAAEVMVAKAGEYFEELEGRREEARQIFANRVSR